MTELSPTLFQLDQVLSFEQQLTCCQLSSCGKLGVAITKAPGATGHAHLVTIALQDQFKTSWINWFSDPLMTPQTLCFSTQSDLILIGTCSGILSVIPTKLLMTESGASLINHGGSSSKKVRVVKGKDEAEVGRRAMPVSISWWATNESKALAIVGTNHGFVIIIDLVDGKEVRKLIKTRAVIKTEFHTISLEKR